VGTLRQNRALFAGFLIALVASGLATPGCSDGDREQGTLASSWPHSVALRPVTANVHADGAARLVGHGPGAWLELQVTGLPPLNDAYVVWLYNAASDAVGVARVARGSFAFRTRLPLDPRRYRYIDISREPMDGNRNHSGASLLRVRIKRLIRAARR
jgi:hypothetical protein